MAKSLNKCTFIGNLGRDPEMRYLGDGTPVCNLAIACGESWKDKNTGEQHEKTEWIQVVAWRKLAEICGQYLKKGSKVYVEGKYTTEKWQDKDGNDRYTTKIIINEMLMLSGQPSGGTNQAPAGNQSGSNQTAPQQPAAPQSNMSNGEFDDDIPF